MYPISLSTLAHLIIYTLCLFMLYAFHAGPTRKKTHRKFKDLMKRGNSCGPLQNKNKKPKRF